MSEALRPLPYLFLSLISSPNKVNTGVNAKHTAETERLLADGGGEKDLELQPRRALKGDTAVDSELKEGHCGGGVR